MAAPDSASCGSGTTSTKVHPDEDAPCQDNPGDCVGVHVRSLPLVTARLGGGKGGAYFGVGGLALAVGGALGNGSGGALIDISARVGLAWLPWVGMCAVAIVSAIGFAWLQRDTRFQKRLAGHPLTFGGKRVPITPPSPAEAAAIRR